jgi:hypothetical protein
MEYRPLGKAEPMGQPHEDLQTLYAMKGRLEETGQMAKTLGLDKEARQAASTRLWSRLAPWSITRFSPYATSSVPMRINSPYSPESAWKWCSPKLNFRFTEFSEV